MEHYSRPPIEEAIFDVRVGGGNASVWAMDAGFSALKERYRVREEIIGPPSIELMLGPDASPAFNFGPILNGISYASKDDKRVFQARLDGFSFNCVGDYDRWETFVAEAKSVWQSYLQERKPQFITRLGLRYLNRFVLPSDGEAPTLGDYFAFAPAWNTKVLGESDGFHLQMAFPYPELEATLLLTQSTSPAGDAVSILLDIDVFCDGLRLDASDEDELWKRAESLRDLKNRTFEACLKPKAKELIR